jgi:hypothetical protein
LTDAISRAADVVAESAPTELRYKIADAIVCAVHASFARGYVGNEALDISLTSAGGTAFKWEDVLGLEVLLDLFASLMAGQPDPTTALMTLLEAWHKLRRVRISLNREELLVMLAVKRGKATMAAIADYAKLTFDQVATVVTSLEQKLYLDSVPLLRREGDRLSTEF